MLVENELRFSQKKQVVIYTLIVGALLAFLCVNNELFRLDTFLILFAISSTLTFIFQLVSKRILSYVIYKYPWEKKPKDRLQRMLFLGLASGLVAGLIHWFVNLLLPYIHTSRQINPIEIIVLYCSVYFSFLSFVEILEFYKQRSISSKNIKRLQFRTTKTKKEVLQDLINPHFMFNSLNTVASIIPDDEELASKFVNELLSIYEFMIENNEKTVINLNEELNIVKKYLFLLETRFGNSFTYSIDIPESVLNSSIPPLALQNLAENAIKHNAITRKKPLKLGIFVEGDYIVAKNNLNPKETLKKDSTNLGLDYINSQYSQINNRKIEILKTDEEFVVKLPIVNI